MGITKPSRNAIGAIDPRRLTERFLTEGGERLRDLLAGDRCMSEERWRAKDLLFEEFCEALADQHLSNVATATWTAPAPRMMKIEKERTLQTPLGEWNVRVERDEDDIG